MAKLVTGLFNTRSSAMLAIEDLMRHGFAQEDLSLLNTDTSLGREFFAAVCSKAPEGAVVGTIIGMIIGGVIAAMIQIGYIPDPGLGLVAMSATVASLLGVAVGGMVGLVFGAVIGSSIPEYEVKLFRADKRQGGILLGGYVHPRREGEVRRLLEAAGGQKIRVKNVRDEKLPERQREFAPVDDRGLTR